MHKHLVDTVRAATDVLSERGDTFDIHGLLYVQGESDSAAEADAADTRLAALIEDLGVSLPSATDLHTVVGGISADGRSRDVVRSRQRELAGSSPSVEYFSNLDLRNSLYDGLHFDRDAKLVIGERFARTFLALDGDVPIVENVPFGDVESAIDPIEVVIEDYVCDHDGPVNGVVVQAENPFTGFIAPPAGRDAIGLLVDGDSGNVVFADYRGPVATADIAVGPFGDSSFPDSGREVSLRFVSPEDAEQAATVSRFAFRLGATDQADKVTVSFFGTDGAQLHSTAVVPSVSSGESAFELRSRAGDPETTLSGIHEIRFRTNGPNGELWALGSFDDQALRTVDFVISGFRDASPSGLLRPGDVNADGNLDVSDPVRLLLVLFTDARSSPPCKEGRLDAPGNRALLDVDQSGEVNITDPILLLTFLFGEGSPPTLGRECVSFANCPTRCN